MVSLFGSVAVIKMFCSHLSSQYPNATSTAQPLAALRGIMIKFYLFFKLATFALGMISEENNSDLPTIPITEFDEHDDHQAWYNYLQQASNISVEYVKTLRRAPNYYDNQFSKVLEQATDLLDDLREIAEVLISKF